MFSYIINIDCILLSCAVLYTVLPLHSHLRDRMKVAVAGKGYNVTPVFADVQDFHFFFKYISMLVDVISF